MKTLSDLIQARNNGQVVKLNDEQKDSQQQEKTKITQEDKERFVSDLISEWENMKATYSRDELILEDSWVMDVRLQLLDGSCHLHFGDAQYDTDHRGYWGQGLLDYDWDEEEVKSHISQLVDDLIAQVEESKATSTG